MRRISLFVLVIGHLTPSQAIASESLARGAELYEMHCALCHQADGHGMKGQLAADFVNDVARMSRPDAALLQSINDGLTGSIGTMPSWRGILRSDDQKSALLYIRKTFDKSAK